ncbi:hypothetical protein [Streptomyces parvulus]|uniref:hypothetical protein n=1 Tax=Streptomyces parvulus TaxID=146923 RepID=UPI0037ACFE72
MLCSAWHGVVSLRLHKDEWNWGMTAQEANRRLVAALTAHPAGPAPSWKLLVHQYSSPSAAPVL